MRLIPFVLLVVFTACANPNEYTRRVDKLESIPGSWITDGVILRADKGDARIEYLGHVFLIKDFDPFRGFIDPKVIMLRGQYFEVRLSEEMFEIGWKNQPPMRWDMADLPTDRLIVFNGRTVEYQPLPPREAPPPKAG